MDSKAPNGAPVARTAGPAPPDGRKLAPVTAAALAHVHPATLLPVADDIRDRTEGGYREHFDRLTADVRQHGVRVPLIVYREAARHRVLDGETRRLAALLAGLESVPVLVHDDRPDEAALKLAQLQANALRKDMTLLELGPVYLDLMRLHGWSQAELARNVHVPPAQVSKALSTFNNLADEVKAMVTAGAVPGRAAYALSRLADVPAQLELARKVRDGLLKVEALEDHVAAALNGGKRPKGAAKGKAFKARVEGAALELPADWTWEKIVELGNRLVEAARRGARMPGLPPAAVLASLLKG